ncbi:MAG: hypothetical protein ACRDGQ_06720 [Candidatus Limnocylindrales bacterium]
MSRTALPIVNPPGPYPALPLGALAAGYVYTAADISNNNSFVSTGRELLAIQNTAGTAGTITVHSVADNLNRTGDITTYSIPASGFALLGPFNQPGWQQSDGTVWVDASAVTVLLAVIRLPAIA